MRTLRSPRKRRGSAGERTQKRGDKGSGELDTRAGAAAYTRLFGSVRFRPPIPVLSLRQFYAFPSRHQQLT